MKLKPGQNDLFQNQNGPRSERKGTCGFHFKIKKNKKKIIKEGERSRAEHLVIIFFIILFFFSRLSLRFTKFRPPDFVGINTESALRDEGYA